VKLINLAHEKDTWPAPVTANETSGSLIVGGFLECPGVC
jgi:hypothetical protein